jgi:hypothetical protein
MAIFIGVAVAITRTWVMIFSVHWPSTCNCIRKCCRRRSGCSCRESATRVRVPYGTMPRGWYTSSLAIHSYQW